MQGLQFQLWSDFWKQISAKCSKNTEYANVAIPVYEINSNINWDFCKSLFKLKALTNLYKPCTHTHTHTLDHNTYTAIHTSEWTLPSLWLLCMKSKCSYSVIHLKCIACIHFFANSVIFTKLVQCIVLMQVYNPNKKKFTHFLKIRYYIHYLPMD